MQKFVLSLMIMLSVAFTVTAQNEKINVKFPTEQTAEKKGGPVMDLEASEVDYGTIQQHSEPLRVLKFANTGTEPLIIKNARGSCGCTVPTWPKEPIMPGDSSQIEVRYATNRLGTINKTITITTNQGNDPVVIKVVGKVLAGKKEESVPEAQPALIKGE